MCPITGRPDFGRVIVKYTPHEQLVEWVSLKDFLITFRPVKKFQEEMAGELLRAIVSAANPISASVTITELGDGDSLSCTAESGRRPRR
jgi:7-cyano-7-deazaguanine reductase